MKFLLVISSPEYILICDKKQGFYLICFLKNNLTTMFFLFFFDKKTIFYPKMIVSRKKVYALKLIHHYQLFDM